MTGSGSGIGRATSLRLASAGARVLSVDLDEAAAKTTAVACEALGVEAAAYGVDVADRAAMAALAATVEGEHGPLDVLVNNAGVGMSARFLDTALDDWDWILSINLMGVINGCHAFGPAMLARGRGHVVNMSSGLGYTPRATESAYCTTKAAVLTLSRCLRADWHDAGVGVSAVCPGVIATPIVGSTRFRGERAAPEVVEGAKLAFARRGHPPELVAEAVVAAVVGNRPVVTAGFEATLGWYAHRLLPSRLGDRLARFEPGRR